MKNLALTKDQLAAISAGIPTTDLAPTQISPDLSAVTLESLAFELEILKQQVRVLQSRMRPAIVPSTYTRKMETLHHAAG